MATYTRVTPANLTNYLAVINDPADGEDANKLAQVDLQTRRFVYDFLSARFDSAASDVLKAAAIVDATVAGKIKGSTSNSGTQQAIVQGTVSTPDLRDGCVTAAKMAASAIAGTSLVDGAVTTVKLADSPNGVATAKLQDLAVTTAKIDNKAVTDTKLANDATTDANRAVGTDHLKDLAVTNAKIAANTIVAADKLTTGLSGQIMVADGSGKFQKVTLTGDATLSSAGVLTIGSGGLACVRERVGNTVVGGASAATTWQVRGVSAAWQKEWETVSLVTIGASGKISLAAGTYMIELSSPAYKVDEHITRLIRYNSSNVVQETTYGSSEVSAAADGVQTRSVLLAKMTFAASDYLTVEHWTKAANGTDGLGHPSGSGGTYEVYATIRIQKVG